MDLKNALLCVECEWLYTDSTSCPRCGSHVAFPVARAMDHDQAVLGRFPTRQSAPRRPVTRWVVFAG